MGWLGVWGEVFAQDVDAARYLDDLVEGDMLEVYAPAGVEDIEVRCPESEVDLHVGIRDRHHIPGGRVGTYGVTPFGVGVREGDGHYFCQTLFDELREDYVSIEAYAGQVAVTAVGVVEEENDHLGRVGGEGVGLVGSVGSLHRGEGMARAGVFKHFCVVGIAGFRGFVNALVGGDSFGKWDIELVDAKFCGVAIEEFFGTFGDEELILGLLVELCREAVDRCQGSVGRC